MDKMKLLIADSTQEFCIALESVLQDTFHIKIAHSATEAMALLDSFAPQVLVLDVTLAGQDGIAVLEYAAQHGHKPKTLATTLFRSDYIFAKLTELGVSYVLMKPCDLKIAAERVREIAQDWSILPARNDAQRLSEILLALGLMPKHNGYHYLTTAVAIYTADRTQSLTKELYAAVGAVYGVGWQQVERSIRTALEAAWERRDEGIWCRWFPAGAIRMGKRPTNGQVICCLAECLQMECARKSG